MGMRNSNSTVALPEKVKDKEELNYTQQRQTSQYSYAWTVVLSVDIFVQSNADRGSMGTLESPEGRHP